MRHETITLQHDLGSFEGYNFREQAAIFPNKTAEEVVNWDHDKDGEAEFWPAGDHAGVFLLFRDHNHVSGRQLVALDTLLDELGNDDLETFVRIHCTETRLEDLSADTVENQSLHIFIGQNFMDLRREAAYELFELYHPEAYAVWEKSTCDGLFFDVDRFLDSPTVGTEEHTTAESKILVVDVF